MNQSQRDYLIREVTQTRDDQIEKLKHKIPIRPSLNNFLIASFLDGSIQFADIELLKTKMRKTVLEMGKDEVLIKERERRYGRSNRDDDEEVEVVEVLPYDLFIIPKAYIDALSEYEEKKIKIEAEIERLEGVTKTIILKLNIGSGKTLDKLIGEVDNMGDLSLVNTQLALEFKTEDKKKSEEE